MNGEIETLSVSLSACTIVVAIVFLSTIRYGREATIQRATTESGDAEPVQKSEFGLLDTAHAGKLIFDAICSHSHVIKCYRYIFHLCS